MPVFVSHASAQASVASEVAQRLDDAGIGAWLASKDIPPGGNYAQAIPEAIRTCEAFLVLVSPESIASGHVSREVDLAVSSKRIIIPICTDLRLQTISELPDAWRYWLALVQLARYENPTQVLRIVRVRLSTPPQAPDTEPSDSRAAARATRDLGPARPPARDRRPSPRRGNSRREAQARSELIQVAAAQLQFSEAEARARRLGYSRRDILEIAYRLREAKLLDFDGDLRSATVMRLT